MKCIITESQYQILLEQSSTFLNLINNVKTISGIIILLSARGFNSTGVDRIQSLVKQYIAGGKINPNKKDMEVIRKYQKMILNNVALNMGYDNWSELKNDALKIEK